MRYAKGAIGRIFLLKFDDDDIVLKELDKFAKREHLKAATFIFLGALKKGDRATDASRRRDATAQYEGSIVSVDSTTMGLPGRYYHTVQPVRSSLASPIDCQRARPPVAIRSHAEEIPTRHRREKGQASS